MRIKCLTPFLDGMERFEKDDIFTVDDERGAYFVASGWAEDLSGAVPTGDTASGATDLAVESTTLTAGDNHG